MHTFQIKFGLLLVLIGLWASPSFGQGWEREFPLNIFPSTGPTPFHTFNAISSTVNGDYIAAGGNLLLNTQPKNISLQRITTNGSLVWRKSYFVDNNPTVPVSNAWLPQKIISTTDSSYVVLVSKHLYFNSPSPYTTTEVIKVNEQGDSLWHYNYSDNPQAYDVAKNIVETSDGGYLIVANHDDYYNGDSTLRQRGASLTKIDAQGQQQWKSVYALKANVHADSIAAYPLTTAVDVLQLTNGNLLLVAKQQTVDPLFLPMADTSVIFHVDATGQQLQTQIYPSHSFSNILPTDNQHFWLTDYSNNHLYLSKLDILGNIVFTSPNALDAAHNINNLHSLKWGSDQNLLALHYYANIGLAGIQKTALLKLDTLGNLIWDKRDTSSYNKYSLFQLVPTPSKGAVAVGFKLYDDIGNISKASPFAIKVDSAGYSNTNLIHGYVAKDSNLNCAVDTNELKLKNWIVKITDNAYTYYTTTNSQGYYELLVGQGNYTVEIITPNNYWTVCNNSQSISFSTNWMNTQADFAIQAAYDCSLLRVDISTPLLRRCFWNRYAVSYCNEGTAIAYNPYVEVSLDPYLTIDSSSIPYTSQNGNTYTFPINDLGINACGQFYIYTTVDCDSTIVGQTHCSEAHIFPDSSCIAAPAWDGSDIQVLASCTGDSIYFSINNIGTSPMAAARNYWIAEDHIMMLMGTYNLGVGQSTQIVIPATGKTYRLEAEQAANHPLRTLAAANVERCGHTSTGTGFSYSLGIIPQYSSDDESPFIALDCQQNVGSWDPNDKQAFPKGYGTAHYINQNQSLDYKIRFQNTGTDTAFTVIILDTISSFLNLSTLQLGASSHPYTWELLGENVVKFTFANIMLPDSNVNEAASHGFIKFKIAQFYNNPLGSRIENQAAIYFDFNAPVLTNTTFHTVGEDFITLSIKKVINHQNTAEVKTYPNPMHNQATIEVVDGDYQELKLTLYDIMGKDAMHCVSTGNKIQIQRGNLPQGIYIYTLEGDGQRIQSGRIIIQ